LKNVKGWECLYAHSTELFLSIYVGFKVAGPKHNLKSMWTNMSLSLDLDPPVPLDGNVYLGCGQHDVSVPVELVSEKQQLYDRLYGDNVIVDDVNQSSVSTRNSNIQIKAYEYSMTGYAEQCVETYLEVADVSESSLKLAETPCMDGHQTPSEDFEAKGLLYPVAARIVRKVLFLARVNRPDLIWTVNAFARMVTQWNVACDKHLHRLMSYIRCAKQLRMHCVLGDPPDMQTTAFLRRICWRRFVRV